MRVGFLLDRVVSRHRNDGLPNSHQLSSGYVLGRQEALDQFPALRSQDLTGAALWYDYVTTEADRLTLSWGVAASAQGAVLVNYVEATILTIEGGRAIGVRAQDRASNRALEIRARVTVNATGGAVDVLLGKSGIASSSPMLKAMNLVTAREAPAAALGGRGRSGRTLFMVPWKNRALFGTWESPRPCAPDDVSVTRSEVAAFITEINEAFPSAALTEGDVTLVHRGVVPAVVRSDGRATLEGHEQVRDHADKGVEGLVSVAGTKYTTARAVAERVTNRLCAKLGRSPVPCRTADEPLPFSELTGDALLVHAARDEMVLTLEDAVVRRTSLGALGEPDDTATGHAATVVGNVLGWDESKRREEVEALRRFYGTLNAWKT
jgi:glycerol-3-phosphate dehydrogenase